MKLCLPVLLVSQLLLPGCTHGQAFRPGETDFPILWLLEDGQSIQVHNLDSTLVLDAGGSVRLTWSEADPVLRVNGLQVRPALPEPEARPSLELLLSFADIPFIRERVNGSRDYDSLLPAYEAFGRERRELELRLQREFAARVARYPSSASEEAEMQAAVASCRDLALRSALVEQCESLPGTLTIRLKGVEAPTLVQLQPRSHWVEPRFTATTSITHEQALKFVEAWVVALRTFARPVTIELGRGRLQIDGGRPSKGGPEK